jgi:hypothetical protein
MRASEARLGLAEGGIFAREERTFLPKNAGSAKQSNDLVPRR